MQCVPLKHIGLSLSSEECIECISILIKFALLDYYKPCIVFYCVVQKT